MSDSLGIVGLTPEQNKFLAYRLRYSSDKDAAEAMGLNPCNPEAWKRRNVAFVQAYNELHTDGIRLAQRITREDLGLAALALRQGLEATKAIVMGSRIKEVPDYKERREAATTILKIHGLVSERIDIELRIRQIAAELGIEEQQALDEVGRILGAGTRQAVGS